MQWIRLHVDYYTGGWIDRIRAGSVQVLSELHGNTYYDSRSCRALGMIVSPLGDHAEAHSCRWSADYGQAEARPF